MYQLPEPRLTLAQRVRQIAEQIILRFVWLARDSEIEFAEVLSAFALVLWGFWLWNPVWETFASSKSFDGMASIASEEMWGGVMLLLGIFQTIAFVREHARMRVAACTGGVFIWATITTMFADANIASTGVPAYTLFTLSNGWALIRLARGNG